MKTPSPLYYNAADVMAAFSRDCEPEAPAVNRRDSRVASNARSLLSAGSRRVATLNRRLRFGLGRIRRAAPAPRPVHLRSAASGAEPQMPGDSGENRHAGPCQPGLTSHFAFVASID